VLRLLWRNHLSRNPEATRWPTGSRASTECPDSTWELAKRTCGPDTTHSRRRSARGRDKQSPCKNAHDRIIVRPCHPLTNDSMCIARIPPDKRLHGTWLCPSTYEGQEDRAFISTSLIGQKLDVQHLVRLSSLPSCLDNYRPKSPINVGTRYVCNTIMALQVPVPKPFLRPLIVTHVNYYTQ
jgi:hypothetical protein